MTSSCARCALRKPADPSNGRAAIPAPARRSISGNQANLRRLQAKLTIGAVNDPLEQEADAAADRVMRMADPEIAHASPPALRRKCAGCEEEERRLQRKAAATATTDSAPPIVDAVLNSPGHVLEPTTHDFMATRFGTDFSNVRIHSDAQAAQSAAAVNARAYTVGRDVVFGAGQYDPRGNTGRRLLAHELAHVVQQRAGATGIQRDLATEWPGSEPEEQSDLTQAQIEDAIRYNRGFYDNANTRLIQSIMGGEVTGQWTADNIRAIAATQEEFGLTKDGKVVPQTFEFITREQTAEQAPTNTANCLTALRVITFPMQGRATPGPGGTTRIVGHHTVEARFSSRCDCSKFEYRQFIAGVASGLRGGTRQELGGQFSHLPHGALDVLMHEDGNTTCPTRNFGHRDQPGQRSETINCFQSHYTDADGTANRARGCVYRAEDHPQITVHGLRTGDTVDLLIQFRGEIRRAGTVVASQSWTDVDVTLVTP